MSITPQLRASARAAYRSLLRSASITFAGDERVLTAFRFKARRDTENGASETNPEAFSANVQHAREVANYLRCNIVQGQRVVRTRETIEGPKEEEVWQLRFTKDTEIGHNDSIFQGRGSATPCSGATSNPPPGPGPEASERRARRLEAREADAAAASTTANASARLSLNYSALKRAHKERVMPLLREEDLEESFVRGSGPGGQSINKTQNNVQLLHKPTGIRVACQETRSLQQNRDRARKILLEKLDHLQNPGLSKGDFLRAKKAERERRKKKKGRKKTREETST